MHPSDNLYPLAPKTRGIEKIINIMLTREKIFLLIILILITPSFHINS